MQHERASTKFILSIRIQNGLQRHNSTNALTSEYFHDMKTIITFVSNKTNYVFLLSPINNGMSSKLYYMNIV